MTESNTESVCPNCRAMCLRATVSSSMREMFYRCYHCNYVYVYGWKGDKVDRLRWFWDTKKYNPNHPLIQIPKGCIVVFREKPE